MASGISRSTFMRPLANAIGWEIGRLRRLLNCADYHAPYDDLPRALRILQIQMPQRMSNILAAMNMDAAVLQNDAEPARQLALMPPSTARMKVSLIDRLAQTIPGTASLTEKRSKVRLVLKKHNADGRMKDEAQAFSWIKKAFPDAVPLETTESRGDLEVLPPIETLPPTRLREEVKALLTQLREKDAQLRKFEKKLHEVNYLLDAAKHKMIGTGMMDVKADQALFILAIEAAKESM